MLTWSVEAPHHLPLHAFQPFLPLLRCSQSLCTTSGATAPVSQTCSAFFCCHCLFYSALSSLIFPFINMILILKSLSFVKAFLSTLSAKCSLLSPNSHHLGHYTGVRLFPLTLSVIFSWAHSLSLPFQMVSPEQVSGSLSCFSAPSTEYCK